MTYGGRVFIGGISSSVSKDDIGNEFSKFGKLRTVWVASKPPGFAFVEYDDDRDAEEAVKSLNGVSLFNENKIRVEISKKRPGQGISSRSGGNIRSDSIRGGPPTSRSNPSNPRFQESFRSGNSTPFKPKSHFLSSAPRSSSGAPRPSQGQRFSRSRPSGDSPRFESGSQTQRFSSNQDSRFSSSRPSGGAPRFGQSSGGHFSSGYKSGGGFRSSRPIDK